MEFATDFIHSHSHSPRNEKSKGLRKPKQEMCVTDLVTVTYLNSLHTRVLKVISRLAHSLTLWV